jgi:hypothetical protein
MAPPPSPPNPIPLLLLPDSTSPAPLSDDVAELNADLLSHVAPTTPKLSTQPSTQQMLTVMPGEIVRPASSQQQLHTNRSFMRRPVTPAGEGAAQAAAQGRNVALPVAGADAALPGTMRQLQPAVNTTAAAAAADVAATVPLKRSATALAGATAGGTKMVAVGSITTRGVAPISNKRGDASMAAPPGKASPAPMKRAVATAAWSSKPPPEKTLAHNMLASAADEKYISSARLGTGQRRLSQLLAEPEEFPAVELYPLPGAS